MSKFNCFFFLLLMLWVNFFCHAFILFLLQIIFLSIYLSVYFLFLVVREQHLTLLLGYKLYLKVLISCSIIIHQGRTLSKPVDVYNLLSTPVSSKQNEKLKVCKAQGLISDKCGAKFGDFAFKGLGNLDFETISRGVLRKSWTYNDVLRLSNALKKILHK